MTEKKALLDLIQFADDGTILVRMKKKISVDGEIMKEEFHRTSITPGTDPVAQMADVNNHLVTMGFSPVPENELTLLSAVVSSAHTEEVKLEYRLRGIVSEKNV